jgi:hypothetical protein
MRDHTHDEFIDRWANYIKDNPDKWRKQHTAFINSQIHMSKQFLRKLMLTKGGKKKIIELYDIRNKIGHSILLDRS